MVIYFTGTGNSRCVAQWIAQQVQDELVDAGVYIKSGQSPQLCSDKPWIFVAPTYSWRIPRVFLDFIKRSSFKGGSKAYFAMTCGSETGCAQDKNEQLCKAKGFEYMGTLGVVMPENYIALFDAPGEEESERIKEQARITTQQACGIIKAGGTLPRLKSGIADAVKSGIVNDIFYKFVISSKKFYATDACISCGKCETLCPLNGIRLVNGKPVWNGSCTHCMACICSCPAKAIEYANATQNKRRYTCES